MGRGQHGVINVRVKSVRYQDLRILDLPLLRRIRTARSCSIYLPDSRPLLPQQQTHHLVVVVNPHGQN